MLIVALVGAGRLVSQVVVTIDAKIGVQNVYSGQGVYADPGNDFWNAVTSDDGGGPFLASDGTTMTDITLSFTGEVPIGYGGVPAFASQLLADYYYTYSLASFTIGGLKAGRTYDFYFYSQAGSSGAMDRAAIFTLDGISQSLTGRFAESFELGVNYVKFTITPDSTSLEGSFEIDVLNGSHEAEFNGLQIVESAIPEPATTAMWLGAAALIGGAVLRGRYGRLGR